MNRLFVAVLIGSDSDLNIMQATVDVLTSFNIPFETKITSAHRTPDETHRYVKDADKRGCAVFIAAAGLAAHLAGTVAAITLKPVIGVPLVAGDLKGLDALLSTVQMPGGVPVATVALGETGAKNAGYLAAQILALSNAELEKKIRQARKKMAAEIKAKDAKIQNQKRH